MSPEVPASCLNHRWASPGVARALKQMHGLAGPAFDSLIEAMADVTDYPDDPLRTFPTSDPLRCGCPS